MQHRIAEVPLPVRIRSHPTDPVSSCLSSKHRTKSVPPKPNRFMADVDPTLMKKVFYIAKRKWEPHIQHHSQKDDLWAGFKVAEWRVFCHSAWSKISPARLKRFYLTLPHISFIANIAQKRPELNRDRSTQLGPDFFLPAQIALITYNLRIWSWITHSPIQPSGNTSKSLGPMSRRLLPS